MSCWDFPRCALFWIIALVAKCLAIIGWMLARLFGDGSMELRVRVGD